MGNGLFELKIRRIAQAPQDELGIDLPAKIHGKPAVCSDPDPGFILEGLGDKTHALVQVEHVVLVGILPEYQNKGISAIFMNELTKIAITNNIISAETNSELEENTKVQDFWKYYDARQHKRKRVYVKLF